MTTSHVLIVGAGTGLSLSTARRFGREGWTVHLMARSPERLGGLAESLAAEGVAVRTHIGDVTDHSGLSTVVAAIDDATPLDACIFQPRGSEDMVDVLQASVDNVRPHLEMLVLGAVAVGSVLGPRMVERRRGSLVFVGGGSARTPLRFFGNLGMAMAGLRNYALMLASALAKADAHAAFYTAAGMIGAEGAVQPGQLDPALMAERMYTLVSQRDGKEVLMTPDGEVVPSGR